MVESLCVYPLFKKNLLQIRSFSPAERTANFLKKHSLRCAKDLHHNKCKLQNCFFLFHFRCWNQMEPHAVSQETRSWWERELSDYCFGQWLVSVWGRGKKKGQREWERAREGGSEWGRAREAAAAVWKSRKSCSVLFHRKTLGSGGDTGESCLTPAPHMSFTHSFKQYSHLQIVSVE